MEIYIIRHAWAAERDSDKWSDDDLRPLAADGRLRFAEMAKVLHSRGVAPTLIASSPLVRCVETAGLLSADVDGRPEVVELNELRPGGDSSALLRWTARQSPPHDRIAWVGHAPDVGLLTAALIGCGGGGLIRFAKGAAASVKFDGSPVAGMGELCWLVTAKMLGC